MKNMSNLPPGVTDYDIEEQAGAFDKNILTKNDEQTLVMILPKLKYGFKAHAEMLLDNHDPTGGMVTIDNQVKALHEIYISATKAVKS